MADKSKASSVLDLDALESESSDLFAFTLGGREIEMADPAELDYRDLMLLDQSPDLLFELAMNKEDADYVQKHGMKGRQVNALVESYMKHYGMQAPGRRGSLRSVR